MRNKAAKLLTNFKRNSLKEIGSDLDSISIRIIQIVYRFVQSQEINIFDNPSKKMVFRPIIENDVIKFIHDDFGEKRSLIATELKQKIRKNTKFCMTHNEFTTVRGIRLKNG